MLFYLIQNSRFIQMNGASPDFGITYDKADCITAKANTTEIIRVTRSPKLIDN